MFRDYTWQGLLALSLCSFALAWAASAARVLSLRRRLAERNAATELKCETTALLARIGVFAGVACFVLFPGRHPVSRARPRALLSGLPSRGRAAHHDA